MHPHAGQCAINVDYQGFEYRVCWTGGWRKRPDLSIFPRLFDATATEIPHGPGTSRIWLASRVIAHGSDAHIRELLDCNDGFPIIKIATNARQRGLVEEDIPCSGISPA